MSQGVVGENFQKEADPWNNGVTMKILELKNGNQSTKKWDIFDRLTPPVTRLFFWSYQSGSNRERKIP